MAAPLTNYTGDAGLGVGSNPQIPVPGDTNLKTINDTVRDIMLLSHDHNLKMFQQKVSDRDTLTQLIADNQVNPGNLEPQYLAKYNEGRQAATKAFDQWRGNFNDHDGYRKYQEAITNLKEVVSHGGANTIELQKLRQQAAQEQLPSKKADILRHIKEQENQDFDQPVKPYQQFRDLNPQTFSGFVEPIKTETRDPNNPALAYDVSKIDYSSILRNSRNSYVHDLDKQNDIRQLYDKFSKYDQTQLPKAVEAINKQIDKYNQQNGFVQGQQGFVDPVNAPIVDGRMVIKEFPADFAAKYALANNEDFITRTPKFDYKLLKAQSDEEKNKIAAKKLGIEWTKANAYAKNLDAKTKKYLADNTQEVTNIIGQYQDFVDNMKPGGITLTDSKTKQKTGELDAVFLDQLPESYRYINGPIVGMKTTVTGTGSNKKTTSAPTGKIEVGRLEPFVDTKGKPYYIPKYVNPKTGDKLTLDSDSLKGAFKKSKDNGFSGSYDDYVRTLLKKGAIEMVLQGQNGAANYTSMFQSAKLLNEQGGKKGEENIVNPPEEGPGETTVEEPAQPDAQ